MTRRPPPQRHSEPQAPGAFLADGCWNPEGELRHRGHTHQLTQALIKERRFARLSPKLASAAIQAASAVLAFPNWRQWETCNDWAVAWTTTSAEEAVKRAGETVAGQHHWCGAGKWLPGGQSSCGDLVHRAVTEPPDIAGPEEQP